VGTVTSSLSVTKHVHAEVWPGITTFDSDVTVGANLTTALNEDVNIAHAIRTDISYELQQAQGGFFAAVEQGLVESLLAGIVAIPGYARIGERAFSRDDVVPNQVFSNQSTRSAQLILRATTVTGLADGLLISGPAEVARRFAPPSCEVTALPFVLNFLTSCSAIKEHGPQAANAKNVFATASITARESATDQLPLVIGAFQLVGSVPADAPAGTPPDSQGQFAPFLPAAPQVPGSQATYQILIPVSDISSGYKSDPYPCQLIVLSNGGARFVSVGAIPVPVIDDHGVVRNVVTVITPDCHDVDLDPWFLLFGVFNPKWNVDPLLGVGDPSREETVGIAMVKALLANRAVQGTPIFVGKTQVGTVSIGTLTAGETFTGEEAAALAARLLEGAARLQPPSFRGGK
jgi:hypothetical protein